MNVGDLKKLIKDLPDDIQVLAPLRAADGFTGEFFSPCIKESCAAELGTEEDDETNDDIINPPKTEKSLVLVPCHFFDERTGPPPELN